MANIKNGNSKKGGGMPRTQRVQTLIDHFMDYYGKKTIPEIAEIFQVDFSTVYNNLHIIAENNNMNREDLLLYPDRGGPHSNKVNPFRKEIVDAQKLNKDFENIDNSLGKIINEIDKILEEEK